MREGEVGTASHFHICFLCLRIEGRNIKEGYIKFAWKVGPVKSLHIRDKLTAEGRQILHFADSFQ